MSENTASPNCKYCDDEGVHKFHGRPCTRCNVHKEREAELLNAVDEGIFNKFIVLKVKEVEVLDYDLREKLTQVLDAIGVSRLNESKPVDREYIVINTDEDYAPRVIEILKDNGHWGEEPESIRIILNAVEKHIETGHVSYEYIVALEGHDPSRVYSVTYSHRRSGKNGMLSRGESVSVIDGMVFNVFDTSNA